MTLVWRRILLPLLCLFLPGSHFNGLRKFIMLPQATEACWMIRDTELDPRDHISNPHIREVFLGYRKAILFTDIDDLNWFAIFHQFFPLLHNNLECCFHSFVIILLVRHNITRRRRWRRESIHFRKWMNFKQLRLVKLVILAGYPNRLTRRIKSPLEFLQLTG